jgi:hypothetical protein
VAGLRTEFPFTLPKGFVDAEGALHRHGTMRLATARDEIEPLRDRNVRGADDPYLTILVLSRVITELGSLSRVTPTDVENFFAADLAFLQDLYGIINFGDPADVEALQASVVPIEDAEGDDTAQVGSDDNGGADVDGDAERSAEDDTVPVPSARHRGRIEEVRRTETS